MSRSKEKELSFEALLDELETTVAKLEAGDRTEAAVWAVKKGLV